MTKTIENINNFETKLGTLWVYFIIESVLYFRCTLQSPYGQRVEVFSSQRNVFLPNKNLIIVFLPFLLLILVVFVHSKARERKKLGFSRGDVNFTIHFVTVLAGVTD